VPITENKFLYWTISGSFVGTPDGYLGMTVDVVVASDSGIPRARRLA
jgi:hypothetical protein